MKSKELLSRNAALAELILIDQALIPKDLQISLLCGIYTYKIDARDNPGYSQEIVQLANNCFRHRLEEGLTEYRARLRTIADVEDPP